MTENRIDVLARALGVLADRRTAARAVTTGSLGLLALLAGHDAEAKKKKKKGKKKKKKKSGACKANQEKCGQACCNANQPCIGGQCLGACQFTVDDTLKTMTLQATCATTETILIPDQFTLEGDGKTIHMAGPVSGYQAESPGGSDVHAGLLIKNGIGSVKNVTIDQDALQCDSGRHSAVVIAGGKGTIDSVEIVVTKDNILCYHGIDAAAAANNDAINIRGVTITGSHRSGIAISGPSLDAASAVVGEIRDCTIGPAIFGMLVRNARFGPSFPITGNSVNANLGIDVAVFPSDVFIDNNTITGLTGATNAFGVQFNDDTKGIVSNNTISGFTCGVSIIEGAVVTVSDNNTFSSNTDNICPPPP